MGAVAMNHEIELKTINLVTRLSELYEYVKTTKIALSTTTRAWAKFNRWSMQLEEIQSGIQFGMRTLLPRLESILRVQFKSSEGFLTILFQPSTRNLFLEIQTHFDEQGEQSISKEVMDHLASLGDFAKMIALLGDAVINMAVLHHLWSPSIDDVGIITQWRAEIVSNENMARLCDEWGLFEHRIHFDPRTATRSEIDHIKGTLIEGIYGLIYIDHGIDRVRETIDHLIDGVELSIP